MSKKGWKDMKRYSGVCKYHFDDTTFQEAIDDIITVHSSERQGQSIADSWGAERRAELSNAGRPVEYPSEYISETGQGQGL